MSDSTRMIKKYYHSIKSINLRAFVDQVDYISALLAELFEADFLAVYYKNEANNHLIPVGYYNNNNLKSADTKKLEKNYYIQNATKTPLVAGLLSLKEVQDSNVDQFALENKFNYLYQFPYYINNEITLLILAYWNEYPTYNEIKLKKNVENVFHLLHNIINSIEEHKKVNDYTIRLSDLIALFEIDLSEYLYSELIEKLINKLKDIVPGGYFVFSINSSSSCDLTHSINIDKPNEDFIAKFNTELVLFSEEIEETRMQKGIWVDYGGLNDTSYKTILASPICIDKCRKTFLLYVSDQVNSLTDNDKQLLSLFSLFSSLILKVSLLLEAEKRVNKLLKKTTSQMADIETLAALTDLTSGVAHEFNNMIGGIVGRVQLLKLKSHDDDTFDKLDKIEKIAQDGAETVRRIQEFSSGAKYKKTKQFDLVNLVNNYVVNNKLLARAHNKNVTILAEIDLQSAFIKGVYDDVFLALNNIVENGIEHSVENSSVLIKLTESFNYYCLTVHNKGNEINKTELKRIFYPFFTKKDTYGAGMGLSIVHGIVSRHGGKISVTSSDSDGTLFKIEFKKVDSIEDESDISRKIKTVKQLKILVVDDDDQIREVLTDMLSIDGYDTIACEDGPSALKAFQKGGFDLVITDLGMPGMSGLELASEIHSQNPTIPIAMITGWGTQLNHDEVALKGIRTVMSKPFHLKDIKAMISELVDSVPA